MGKSRLPGSKGGYLGHSRARDARNWLFSTKILGEVLKMAQMSKFPKSGGPKIAQNLHFQSSK